MFQLECRTRLKEVIPYLLCYVTAHQLLPRLVGMQSVAQIASATGRLLKLFGNAAIGVTIYQLPYLRTELSPTITRHGVLVEVYGEGVLLVGESGVGKSETAIELVKRGHRLIADDAVEIRRSPNGGLVGTAPELIRHYIELRGIGVVDVRRLFGMSAVKFDSAIDMKIQLEMWQDGKVYDRLGADEHFTSLLDVSVPTLTIPVKPGRNLAVIIEVAAMNNRNKKMGYNAALEFSMQVDSHIDQKYLEMNPQ